MLIANGSDSTAFERDCKMVVVPKSRAGGKPFPTDNKVLISMPLMKTLFHFCLSSAACPLDRYASDAHRRRFVRRNEISYDQNMASYRTALTRIRSRTTFGKLGGKLLSNVNRSLRARSMAARVSLLPPPDVAIFV